jgi:FdhD protein
VLGVELRSSSKISLDRDFMSSSSCGACGKRSIAAIRVQAPVNTSRVQVSRSTLAQLPEALRLAQALFDKTGGVHASGLFTLDGELLALREDVGRHNALDKLIGWALLN